MSQSTSRFTASSRPAISPNSTQARVSAVASTTGVTATITNSQVAQDLGYSVRTAGTVTITLHDLFVYSDTAGALVAVNTGSTQIWETYVDKGFNPIRLSVPLVCEIGDDLNVVLTGATSFCSIALTGLAIQSHTNGPR